MYFEYFGSFHHHRLNLFHLIYPANLNQFPAISLFYFIEHPDHLDCFDSIKFNRSSKKIYPSLEITVDINIFHANPIAAANLAIFGPSEIVKLPAPSASISAAISELPQ